MPGQPVRRSRPSRAARRAPAAPPDRRGGRTEVLDAQRAIAELKAVQAKLVEGETLRALGDLSAGAGHHLNNLLTIVIGRVQLLLRTVEGERLRRSLETIERAAKDCAEVVRRLQQFSSVDGIARPRSVDLNEVVRDVVELTRIRWQDAARVKGVRIEVERRLGALPEVVGDQPALRELLTNLVLNAVDAMPQGGRLTVSTWAEPGGVCVAVADTGVGMPDEVRRRAHEPFFTTKGVKATGLGLSVSYGIARRHGGEIDIRSGEGRGTTVTVRLPVAAAAPPSG